MDLETFERMRAALELREKLDMVNEARKAGVKDVKASDTVKHMYAAVKEAAKHV